MVKYVSDRRQDSKTESASDIWDSQTIGILRGKTLKHTLEILGLGPPRQEGHMFEASLDDTERSCLKTKQKQ